MLTIFYYIFLTLAVLIAAFMAFSYPFLTLGQYTFTGEAKDLITRYTKMSNLPGVYKRQAFMAS
ncbi:hypothetical protein B0T25DRAFT_569540 [Lasiosphaeria hispida]|uniref:Uncharacterized protein n=1 Tax=Lasiosphaeria hispida TaxID=260671 RepID=A0AAJ0HDL2_9PEZI|nr:hypothetical protein B0T25DRAFT_569540 [Lasiosphaeria hispida]